MGWCCLNLVSQTSWPWLGCGHFLDMTHKPADPGWSMDTFRILTKVSIHQLTLAGLYTLLQTSWPWLVCGQDKLYNFGAPSRRLERWRLYSAAIEGGSYLNFCQTHCLALQVNFQLRWAAQEVKKSLSLSVCLLLSLLVCSKCNMCFTSFSLVFH